MRCTWTDSFGLVDVPLWQNRVTQQAHFSTLVIYVVGRGTTISTRWQPRNMGSAVCDCTVDNKGDFTFSYHVFAEISRIILL